MIPAKKLLPEAEETAASDQQETKYQSGDSQLHNLVKLLIIMLLSYVIIFM